MLKIRLNFQKICFMLYSTTQSTYQQNKSDLILRPSWLTLYFNVKFNLQTMYNNTQYTPCTLHTVHHEHYIRKSFTIHTACLAQYTLHTRHAKCHNHCDQRLCKTFRGCVNFEIKHTVFCHKFNLLSIF